MVAAGYSLSVFCANKSLLQYFGRSRNPAPKTQGVKIKLNTVILWLDRRIQFFLWIARSSRAMTQLRKQFIPVPRSEGVLANSLNEIELAKYINTYIILTMTLKPLNFVGSTLDDLEVTYEQGCC